MPSSYYFFFPSGIIFSVIFISKKFFELIKDSEEL